MINLQRSLIIEDPNKRVHLTANPLRPSGLRLGGK